MRQRLGTAGAGLRWLTWRTLRADLWIIRVGLLCLSAYSGLYFAVIAAPYAAAPLAYRAMARLDPHLWALVFGALAALTATTLWGESRDRGGAWCRVTWHLHAPLWTGIGLSFVLLTDGAWSSWLFVAFGVIAEWVVVQPAVLGWIDRRERGRRGE